MADTIICCTDGSDLAVRALAAGLAIVRPRDGDRVIVATVVEPVDASRGAPDPDAGTRIVGEWFDPDRTEVPGAQRRAAAGEMRRAARRARDAVENQQVPRRYRDLVQRVFERVDSRAGELDAETVAPQGADAP